MRSLTLLLILGALATALLLCWLLLGEGAAQSDREASHATQQRADVEEHAPDSQDPQRSSDTSATATRDLQSGSSETEPVASDSAATFSGRVLDARGAPIAKAQIDLAARDRSRGLPLDSLDPERLPWAGRVQASANELGRFEIQSQAPGRSRLRVRAPGFAPLERELSTHDARHDLGDLVLDDSVVLSGRVLDAAHRAVASATLRRLALDAEPSVILGGSGGDIVATTAPDGTFRIDELASGRWRLAIQAEGHPDKLVNGETSTPGQQVSGLEFVLDDGAEIHGRVVQAPESELRELWIRAVPKNLTPGGKLYVGDRIDEQRFLVLPRGARCATDGSFVLRGLTPDITYRLAGRASEHDSFGEERTNALDVRAGTENVELSYIPPTVLAFQVVDASSGAALESFEARLVGARGATLVPSDGAGHPARSFAEGRATIERGFAALDEGALELVITATGYAPLRVPDVRVTREQRTDLGALRLTPGPVLQVHVVNDASGAAVAGATVEFDPTREATSARRATTDPNGVARLDAYSDAEVACRVQHPDFAPFSSAPQRFGAELGQVLDVRLRPGAKVVVEVRDSSGAKVRGARVTHASPTKLGAAERETDAQGRARFEHLEAGRHCFAIDGEPASNAGARRELELGEREETLTLTVSVRHPLSGRVVEAGAPLAGATLRFEARDAGARSLDARTNGAGTFNLAHVEPGVWRVRVLHPKRAWPFETEVDVRADTSTLELALPLVVVEGRIVDADRQPIAGANVRLELDAPFGKPARVEGATRVRSDLHGAYALVGAPVAVDFAVVAEADGFQSARSPSVRLLPDDHGRTVDLLLKPGAALQVRVERADGGPTPACRVSASRQGEPSFVEALGTDRVARLRGLAAGRWKLRVEELASGASLAPEIEVEVALGVSNSARIELR